MQFAMFRGPKPKKNQVVGPSYILISIYNLIIRSQAVESSPGQGRLLVVITRNLLKN